MLATFKCLKSNSYANKKKFLFSLSIIFVLSEALFYYPLGLCVQLSVWDMKMRELHHEDDATMCFMRLTRKKLKKLLFLFFLFVFCQFFFRPSNEWKMWRFSLKNHFEICDQNKQRAITARRIEWKCKVNVNRVMNPAHYSTHNTAFIP